MRNLTWLLLGILIALGLGANAASGGKLGEQLVTLARAIAGERGIGSLTGADYLSVSGEYRMKSIAYNGDLAARTILSGPCLIAGIEVTTAMSAHASNLKSSSTNVYPIPASRAAGLYPFPAPLLFDANCVWDPGSLSAGAINVWYRPADSGVTWTP